MQVRYPLKPDGEFLQAGVAELLGEVVWDTKTNLEKRMMAEAGACEDKFRIAKNAKAANLDAIHDTVHEMAKDYDTCFFERYAPETLKKCLGHDYDDLVNMNRPDLQSLWRQVIAEDTG